MKQTPPYPAMKKNQKHKKEKRNTTPYLSIGVHDSMLEFEGPTSRVSWLCSTYYILIPHRRIQGIKPD